MRTLPSTAERTRPEVALRILASLMLGKRKVRTRIMDDIRIRADLDSALGLSLFRYGLSEPTAAAIRANLKPGDTFIDGGANIGLMTLVGARAVGPTGQVLAVEPTDSLVRLLADNLDLNHVTWVQVIGTALAEDDRETVLHVFDGDAAGSSSLSRLEGSVAQAVRTATLDGLVDRADLVKLDLEGAEVRALNGATRLLSEIRPKFIVEVEADHLRRHGNSAAELWDVFADAGYRAHGLDGDYLGDRPVIHDPTCPNVLFIPT